MSGFAEEARVAACLGRERAAFSRLRMETYWNEKCAVCGRGPKEDVKLWEVVGAGWRCSEHFFQEVEV